MTHHSHSMVVVNKVSPQSTSNSGTTQTYHDMLGQFYLEYPSGWQIKTDTISVASKPTTQTVITSPTGHVKTVVNFDQGPVYSVCDPDIYHDVPFSINNRCFSSEYLAVYPLSSTVLTTENNMLVTKNLEVVHYHFKTTGINAFEQYSTCISDSNPPVNKPLMGFEPVHPSFSVSNSDQSVRGYVTACADVGTSVTDYQTSEAQEADIMLRSFRFDN